MWTGSTSVDGSSGGGGRQSADLDPAEADEVEAAGVGEELSLDDDEPPEEPLDAVSDAEEEDLRLSVR